MVRSPVAARLALIGFGAALCSVSAYARSPGPVIDMHVHAMQRTLAEPIKVCPGNRPMTFPAVDPLTPYNENNFTQCDRPIPSATNPAELRDRTIAALRANGVRRAVVMARPDALPEWIARAPDIVIPATFPTRTDKAAIEALRNAHNSGRAAIFAEIGAQYAGRRADDPEFEPFWALAEELDVPVGIHLGEGMTGQDPRDPDDPYRVALISPFQLEEVLLKHPRLRLYVMHAASPLIEQMIAMLYEYPTLYVDVAANDWNMPRAQFYEELKRMVDAGFEKRILFGSDQTLFPQAIGLAIETIEQAPFLTEGQKRDILYNNAARFLRLSKEQIARDHAPPKTTAR